MFMILKCIIVVWQCFSEITTSFIYRDMYRVADNWDFKGLFIWARFQRSRLTCESFKIFDVFILEGGLARLPRSRFFQPGSRLAGWKILPYEHFVPVTGRKMYGLNSAIRFTWCFEGFFPTFFMCNSCANVFPPQVSST